MAMDAQGPERPRTYIQKAQATFPCLIDEENRLGQLLSFKAIPNGLLIDEKGFLQYKRFGGFDIRKHEIRRLVEDWLNTSKVVEATWDEGVPLEKGALELFQQGLTLYRQGDTKEATSLWRRAVALDPDNYVIRKQLWAMENPDRFYSGEVDFAWQKDRRERGL